MEMIYYVIVNSYLILTLAYCVIIKVGVVCHRNISISYLQVVIWD